MTNLIERHEVAYMGDRKVKGLELNRVNGPKMYGFYELNGARIMQIIRFGNSTRTAGGATVAGYRVVGETEIFKTIPLLLKAR